MDNVTSEGGCRDGHKYNLLEEATFSCMGCNMPMEGGTLEHMHVDDGDALLVTLPGTLSDTERETLRANIQGELDKLGKKTTLLVLPAGATISKQNGQTEQAAQENA